MAKRQIFYSFLVFLIFQCAIMQAGCSAAVNQKMQSWDGKHYNDLIANWGAPQEVLDDGQGGKILIFSAQRTFTSPAYSTSTATGSGSLIGTNYYGSARGTTTSYPAQSSGYTASRMFWVNKDGYVYRWAWKGL